MSSWLKLHDQTVKMAMEIGGIIRVDRHDHILLYTGPSWETVTADEPTYVAMMEKITQIKEAAK